MASNHRLWRRDCLKNDCVVSAQMGNYCWPKGVVAKREKLQVQLGNGAITTMKRNASKLSGLSIVTSMQSTANTTSYDAFVIYFIYLVFNDGYYVACQWSDKYVGQCK